MHRHCFFNVGPPKESIFFDLHLWSIFQSSLHIRFTDYIFHVQSPKNGMIKISPKWDLNLGPSRIAVWRLQSYCSATTAGYFFQLFSDFYFLPNFYLFQFSKNWNFSRPLLRNFLFWTVWFHLISNFPEFSGNFKGNGLTIEKSRPSLAQSHPVLSQVSKVKKPVRQTLKRG